MGSGGLSGGIYRPLNPEQVDLIHGKALDLLEEVGMAYESGQGELLAVVEKAGCRVDRSDGRIYFPRALVEEMVARAPGEFTLCSRDGRNDLVISHDYGNCMFWCRPEDGKISWLENPGAFDDGGPLWNVHFISDLMATHRLQFGHFSQTERLELMALPVVGCRPFGQGVHEPAKGRRDPA